MALDTAAKRFSAIHVMSPWRGLNVLPTGTITQAQRQGLARLYLGILAGAPIIVVGGQVWVWVNAASIPPESHVQGSQDLWMVRNGIWVMPVKLTPPWPARGRARD